MYKEYVCKTCGNTGSASDEGFMDCAAPGCEAAAKRTAFDKWLLREGYGFSGIKEWSIYRHVVRTEMESMPLVLEENEKLKQALEDMQGRMGKLIAEKVDAEARALALADLHVAEVVAEAAAGEAPAAPAAAVVTVDTPHFRMRLSTLDVAGEIPNNEAGYNLARAEFIAHIDAHTAAVAAKAQQEGWDSCAKANQELIRQLRDQLAAPQQHAQAVLSDERESQTISQLRKSLAGWQEECEVLRRDRDGLRQRLDLQALHQKNDVWYWQGDGTDYPESISNSMAVVIRGDQLRAILATSQEVKG